MEHCDVSGCRNPAAMAVIFTQGGPEYRYCVYHDARSEGPRWLKNRGWQPWQLASVRELAH